jgi:[acyl-carrier-protein] S-malonyltransferase
MLLAGVTTFVEIGPGDVLAALIKRIDRKAQTLSIGDTTSLQASLKHLCPTITPS